MVAILQIVLVIGIFLALVILTSVFLAVTIIAIADLIYDKNTKNRSTKK